MSLDPTIGDLLVRNAQWAAAVSAADPDFFPNSAAMKQAPKVLWIGCADSRVPESVITASKPGDIFVTRNIANQFTPSDDSAQSVVAYGVGVLGAIHVIVTGHTKCGGVEAAYDEVYGVPHVDPDTPLSRYLAPLVALAKSLKLGDKPRDQGLAELRDANVRQQVVNLAKSDTIVNAWKAGKPVFLHGWLYVLEDGLLQDLEVSFGPLDGAF